MLSIQNHTSSHLELRFGLEVTNEFLSLLDEDLEKIDSLIEKTFKPTPMGFLSPRGFPEGLKGENKILKVLWNNGIHYVSFKAVGKHGTIPAPLSYSLYYDEEDISHLLPGIPVQG